MQRSVASRVFEPFYSTKGAGSGLGLASSLGIVQQAGGGMEVDGRPGLGACFTIWLPRVEDEAAPGESTPQPVPSGAATVLVAEDQPALRRLISSALGGRGYRVLVAESGEEALAVAEAEGHAIDVLLTDVVMPRMGGRELAAAIRARRPDVPVLFMSGYAKDEDADALGSGARTGFLSKPFSIAACVLELERLLAAAATTG
jgi:CheY-like chemotaxis protein